MIRIAAPAFVAGAVLVGGFVVNTAPIIRFMVGWDYDKVIAYCRRRRWQTQLL